MHALGACVWRKRTGKCMAAWDGRLRLSAGGAGGQARVAVDDELGIARFWIRAVTGPGWLADAATGNRVDPSPDGLRALAAHAAERAGPSGWDPHRPLRLVVRHGNATSSGGRRRGAATTKGDQAHVTYVSMFMDLAAREPEVGRHSAAYYLLHASAFLRQGEARLLIYVDPAHAESVRAARLRVDPQSKRTCIVVCSFESLAVHAHLPQVEAAFRAGRRPARYSALKDTPRFVLLTLAKFSALLDAVRRNPFGSSHVYWHDLALAYCQTDPRPLAELEPALLAAQRVRLNVCREVWPDGDVNATAWYSQLRQGCPAGLFGGPRRAVVDLCRSVMSEWRAHSLPTWPALEEAVLARLVARDWGRFDLWPCVYERLLRPFDWDSARLLAAWLRARGMSSAAASLLQTARGQAATDPRRSMHLLAALERQDQTCQHHV